MQMLLTYVHCVYICFYRIDVFSIAASSPSSPDLVHFGDPLLEFVVLAFLIAMSFVLVFNQLPSSHGSSSSVTHHTLPR